MSKIKLCVNVDHIATVREARGGIYPDPVEGARICEDNGAHGITVHLREDRRHILDDDVIALRDVVRGKYNLEMALSDEIIAIAKRVVPNQVTLVPEKREELTTEGGLDVKNNFDKIKRVTSEFRELGIVVSLFIEPDKEIIKLSHESGAEYIEIHTGTYCDARDPGIIEKEKNRIYEAAQYAVDLGIGVNAGHGLNLGNLPPLMDMAGLDELNIGHSIISRSIFVGLPSAVKEMLDIIA
ncbi:MAG: pyridoxine 5'-phosphate synthase [bacterium]|nr:pyridoxine 5'-phosphate synthase [bacterium]